MKTWNSALLVVFLAVLPARAHFIWIVPDKVGDNGSSARVFFSDNLKPDNPEMLAKIARTELFVRNDNYVPVTSYRPLYYTGCPGIGSTICDAPIPTFKTVQIFPVSNLSSNGLLFHPLREQAGALSFAARVRDTSRESEDFGAELPIVRESGFRRGGKIVFPDVIIDPRYRTTLRFYSIDDAFLDIEVLQGGVTVGFRFLNPTKGAGDVAWTATVDLSSIVRRSTSNRYTVVANVGSLVARVWAFVSVTNNTTQRVTIISPQ